MHAYDPSILATYLRLDVQDTPPSLLLHLPHRLEARPVKVSRELRVLDKCALLDELLELVHGYKVVLLSIDLAWSWITSGVWARSSLLFSDLLTTGGTHGKR